MRSEICRDCCVHLEIRTVATRGAALDLWTSVASRFDNAEELLYRANRLLPSCPS